MSERDDPPLGAGTVPRDAASAPAAESALEKLAAEWVRETRADRRWRVFFRLAWLGLAALLVLSVVFQRSHVGSSVTPHTALIEVRGEIAADTEASAEALLGAI